MKSLLPARGDLWGGLAAATLLIPQSTAFGIALWAPYASNPGMAALSGLITAFSLSLLSGLGLGTKGMVSSPTGPTMVMLSAALANFQLQGMTGQTLLENTLALLLLTGLIQAAIGLSKGGQLIKYIPYPVITGFMSGAALLMILSQAKSLNLQHYQDILSQNLWLPWLTALITVVAIVLGPRITTRVPKLIVGLLLGTGFYHLMLFLLPIQPGEHWTIGQLPQVNSLNLHLPRFSHIDWFMLAPFALMLAILASIDTLLTAVIADVMSRSRHSAQRELTSQGLGQMLSGILGGTAGAGTTGATIVAINTGGGYPASIVAALAVVLFTTLFSPVIAILPISVLAGIILHVALFGMLDFDVYYWLRRRSSRPDALVALTVTGITVFYDLMVAVGVGLSIAILQFIRAQIHSPIIHRRSNVDQHPSSRIRSKAERKLLLDHAESIVIYELTGNLFFGTVDRLFEDMAADLDRPVHIILDLARVQRVDLTAARMFQQMADRLHQAGGELIFTNVRSGKGLSRKVDKTLRKISPHQTGRYSVRSFIDDDEAIEYAENHLLASLGSHEQETQLVQIEDTSLMRGLSKHSIEILRHYMSEVFLKQGEILFEKDSVGDALYLVKSGEVDILIPIGEHHHKRLSKIGPGAFFGEIVFLIPGPRTAMAKAMQDTCVLKLQRRDFLKIREKHPHVAIELLMRLSTELSDRLRHSDEELRRLAE